MYFILTAAGIAYLKQNPVAPALSSYKLGHSYGYPPDPTSTDIMGPVVYTGIPSAPSVRSSNLLCYSIVLERTVGPFSFGEVGLYLPDGTLFAVGVNTDPLFKNTDSGGNTLTVDCYIPTDTNVRAAYASVTNSAAQIVVPAVTSVDALPAATDTPSNVYITPSPEGNDANLLAIALDGLWSISGYSTFVGEGYTTADLNPGDDPAFSVGWINGIPYPPQFLGNYICQFTSGPAAGVIRIVSNLNGSALAVYQGLNITVPEGTGFKLYRSTQLPDIQTTFLSGLNPSLTASEVNALHGLNLANLVNKDGSVAMTGALDMGNKKLTNLAYPQQPQDGVSLEALTDLTEASTTAITALISRVSALESAALLKTGANAMAGSLSLGGNKVQKMADGVSPTDAVNLRQLTTAVEAINPLTTYSPPASLPCSGALNAETTWSVSKSGNVVTLTLQPVQGLASASPSFTFGATLPLAFRPSFAVSQQVPIKNADSNQATPGVVVVYPDTGTISVFRDATTATNFTAGQTAGFGMGVGVSITWTV